MELSTKLVWEGKHCITQISNDIKRKKIEREIMQQVHSIANQIMSHNPRVAWDSELAKIECADCWKYEIREFMGRHSPKGAA